MSKNNYIWSDNFTNTNTHCSVKEFLAPNKESKKCLIALPWLMYRTHHSTWDLKDLVHEHDASFVFFDYPKTEFNIDKVTTQIIDYIKNHPYDEIILMWLSFWEIVARQVIDRLPDDQKNKIKHHISSNWVSTANDLSVKYKTMLTSCKIKSSLLNSLVWVFWKVDRKTNAFFTKSQVYNKIMKQKIKNTNNPDEKHTIELKQKRHQMSASLWFTPGYVDRARFILQEKNTTQIDIPSSIIYSNNDEFYSEPKSGAENITKNITAENKIYEVDKWWHIALVELPEQYNPVIEKILEKVRRKQD